MGRPKELEEAKMTPVILDRETREIIEQKKGDRSVSAFIRDSIRFRLPGSTDSTDRNELKKLREENKGLLHELDSYKTKEKAITKERQDVLAYIAQGFKLYKQKNPRSDDPSACHSWLSSRCKDSGVTPADVLYFLSDSDLVNTRR